MCFYPSGADRVGAFLKENIQFAAMSWGADAYIATASTILF
jgi:hypothetical protein